MADPKGSHIEALHKLQAMLNLTLTEIGKTFDKPSRRNPNSVARTKHQLRTVLNEVELNFHDALDELESELSRARDVMRRDLGSILSERQTRLDQMALSAAVPSQIEDAHMTDAPSPYASIAPIAPMVVAANPEMPEIIKSEAPDANLDDIGASIAAPLTVPSALGTTTQPAEVPKKEEAAAPAVPNAEAGPVPPAPAEVPAQNDDSLGLGFDSVFDDLPLIGDGGEGSLADDLDFNIGGTEDLLPGLESYADMDSDLQAPAESGKNHAGPVMAASAPTTTAPGGNELTAADFSAWKSGADAADGGQHDSATGDGILDGNGAFAELFSFTDFDNGGGEGPGAESLDDLF